MLQGFSAADLPHVELASSRGGRSSLFRASAARFFDLRSQVPSPSQSKQVSYLHNSTLLMPTCRHIVNLISEAGLHLLCFEKALQFHSMILAMQQPIAKRFAKAAYVDGKHKLFLFKAHHTTMVSVGNPCSRGVGV